MPHNSDMPVEPMPEEEIGNEVNIRLYKICSIIFVSYWVILINVPDK